MNVMAHKIAEFPVLTKDAIYRPWAQLEEAGHNGLHYPTARTMNWKQHLTDEGEDYDGLP
jgi:hypothetical protein